MRLLRNSEVVCVLAEATSPFRNPSSPPYTSVADRGACGTQRKELRVEMETPGLSTCSKLITWVTCSNNYSTTSLNFNHLSVQPRQRINRHPRLLWVQIFENMFFLILLFPSRLGSEFGMQYDVIK